MVLFLNCTDESKKSNDDRFIGQWSLNTLNDENSIVFKGGLMNVYFSEELIGGMFYEVDIENQILLFSTNEKHSDTIEIWKFVFRNDTLKTLSFVTKKEENYILNPPKLVVE